ncbi:hypothetical protein BFP70_04725 [Thioclava sp. SK-1]|uniref:TonB-dependent receptor n=1 Tax=Thioclava sp. SK-1 TaxID=1889770 RepID=UPI000824CFCE|nr:TonB-dependent siderophore receptor [Thioclava sp. SK-1]OCX66531.1 hypothetical protein BFP70_04725 [Thioclava sp. SK-1]
MPQTSKLPLLLLSASALALQIGAAHAQEDIALAPIVVEGQADPTAATPGYVATTSAATKTGTPILEQQGSVAVITRDAIEDQGASNIAEALGYTAGVVTENYGNDPRFDSFYLRGYDLQNNVYLDGLRLQRSFRPDYGAPSFEIYGVERAELLKGPASVLFGAASPAGVLNLVQKRANLVDTSTQIGTSFDNNGSAAVFADGNRVVSDTFAYRLTGKLSNTKGEVEEFDNPHGYLGIATTYQPTDNTTVQVLGSYQKDEPKAPTGVPNSFVGEYPDDALRGFYFADTSADDSDRSMANIGVIIDHDFGNGWSVTNSTRFSKFTWDYGTLSVGTPTGTMVPRSYLTQSEDTWSLTTDTRLQGQMQTGAVEHNLTLGLDARRFSESALTGLSTASGIDYANPSYGNVTIGAPWYTADKNVDVTQVGLYALDELELGNWRGSLALRHDWNRQRGQNVTNYSTSDLDRDDSETTGRVGLGYVWDSGVSSYLSYATSFAPQADTALNGKLLKPTKGKQWELGAKYEPTGFDGFFSAAIYDLTETNRNSNVMIGGVSETVQVGQANVRGLELEGVAQLAQGWTLHGAYSYADSRIDSGENAGNALSNTPDHSASLWLSYHIAQGMFDGLTLGGGLRYIGERWADNANSQTLDAVTLVDLGVSYDWMGATARLNISNLTDKAYVSAVGFQSTYYGDGRTVAASLTYDF